MYLFAFFCFSNKHVWMVCCASGVVLSVLHPFPDQSHYVWC